MALTANSKKKLSTSTIQMILHTKSKLKVIKKKKLKQNKKKSDRKHRKWRTKKMSSKKKK